MEGAGLKQLAALAGSASAPAMASEELKEMVGWAGMFLCFIMFGLSLPVLTVICKAGGTKSFSFYPYLGQFANCFAWVVYDLHHGLSLYLENFVTNVVGLLIASTSLGIFVYFGTGRRKIAVGVGILVLLAILSVVTDGVKWWGTVTLVGNCLLFIAPLRLVTVVWRTKSVESMPLSVAGAGMVGALPWCLYGLLLQDPVCWGPNALGIVLSASQSLLWIVTVYVRGAEVTLHSDSVPVMLGSYIIRPRASTWGGPTTELSRTNTNEQAAAERQASC